MVMYQTDMGTVVIYISSNWKDRFWRALGHIFDKTTWTLEGIALMPYHEIDIQSITLEALNELKGKPN